MADIYFTLTGTQYHYGKDFLEVGMRICVVGRIQTGSYTNRDGQKVYTTYVVVEEQEFAESKGASENNGADRPQPTTDSNGFMNIPDGIDEELPFN